VFFYLASPLVYGVLADLMSFWCLVFLVSLDVWIGSGAPIIPMKGCFCGLVQLLVHGSHYPISWLEVYLRERERDEMSGRSGVGLR
jgi:hypothetical protein